VLVLALGAVLPAKANAGSYLDSWLHRDKDCPRPSYSCLHILAPSLYTYRAYHHDLRGAYAMPDRYPQVPTSYRFDKFVCPTVPPANAPSNLNTR
jgi:hypothetical protein